MNTKTLASAIIGLCLVSIIVGIVNTSLPASHKGQNEEAGESKSFQNIFFGGNKIALISLDGEITSEVSSGFMGPNNSAESVRRALRRASEDVTVKGILLRVNTPGGTVGMSQEISREMLRLRKKKPVVVSMADVAASGGYYIASAADRIYADPGTLTGSIGVIMSSFNAQELLNNKLGIQSNVIKSGKFKDIGSPYRPISQDEKQLLQNIIDSTYEQFITSITEGRVNREDNYKIAKRSLTAENLRKYADGRIFTGQTAQKLGFVDQLGGLYEAQAAVNKMAKSRFDLPETELPLVPYNVPTGIGEVLFGASEAIMNKKDAVSSSIPFSAKYPRQPLVIWE